jgi:CRISPR-associated protein Cas1
MRKRSNKFFFIPEHYPMTTIYLTEHGSLLSRRENKLIISQSQEMIKDFPIEKVESIVLIGSASITSPLMTELMERDITLTWISSNGKFYGRLEPSRSVNIERQMLQFKKAEDEEFSLAISKKWIEAKLRNSIIMLNRWSRERELIDLNQQITQIKETIEKITYSNSLDNLRGLEGYGSKCYFDAIKRIVPPQYEFKERNRQPPRDAFNSLLSFAYTLLIYEIYTAITLKGLHPYRSFLHSPRRGHPALASDLMEEWRALFSDALAMNSLTHKIVTQEDFVTLPESKGGGVYLSQTANKKFINQFEKKLRSHNRYLDYIDYPTSFRESIAFQVGSLVKAIENNDPDIYRPILIR